MCRKSKTFLFCAVLLVMTCAASAFLLTRASTQTPVPSTQAGEQGRHQRQLSRRPEAMNMSRRLGNRFDPSTRSSSVLAGSLFIGGSQNTVTITRNQTETGEAVEIAVGADPATLKWTQTDGPKSSLNALTKAQRVLIERLVFDSSDYFVLAQLRGASYYTVARNVRLEEAGGSENYSGPLWNIVRVDDAEKDAQKKPISSWRLF